MGGRMEYYVPMIKIMKMCVLSVESMYTSKYNQVLFYAGKTPLANAETLNVSPKKIKKILIIIINHAALLSPFFFFVQI